MAEGALILVVDDDADVREALTDALSDEGYRVATAEHGAAALAWLRAGNRPDLVLLDLMMPVMDGASMRTEMLTDPELAALTVVLVTADRRAHELVEELAAAALLAKPVQLAELLGAVAKHIRGHDG